MASISAIATHDATHGAPARRPMGLQRAVITRRVLLGDCTTLRDNARAMFSRRYWQRPACVVPLGAGRRRGPSAADLAVDVSRQLMGRMPPGSSGRVGAVIYCHEAPDERMSESTVGRLQFELALRAANPFAISQAHHTALWIALDMALGLVDGPEQAQHVLLVASDKLVFGGPGTDARRLIFGDVAAAALVSRGEEQGWAVEQVLLRHFTTPCDALAVWPQAELDAFAQFGAGVLRQALAEGGQAPGNLQAVLTTSPDAAFAARVHLGAGLVVPAATAAPRQPQAGSADLLLALAAVEAAVPAGARVLAWSAGNNGEFACTVLRRL
ncbi:hypothetical protein [Ideonella sp.]|uniref:hypothetical protein n=1 Tax=Ideonella sp. TaxID=1929293 RepID=UPI0035AECC2A